MHILSLDINIFRNKLLREFTSKGFNHIPILPINPKPIIKELHSTWIWIASIMHINVVRTHFDIIQEIVKTKFFKKIPNFIKNQSPWFLYKDLLDENRLCF